MNKITRKKPNYRTIHYIGNIQKIKCVGYYEKMYNLGRRIVNTYLYYSHKNEMRLSND